MNQTLVAFVLITVLALLVVIFGKRGAKPSRIFSTEQDIVDAVSDGRRMDAIKHYRNVHDVNLKDAKAAIEKQFS